MTLLTTSHGIRVALLVGIFFVILSTDSFFSTSPSRVRRKGQDGNTTLKNEEDTYTRTFVSSSPQQTQTALPVVVTPETATTITPNAKYYRINKIPPFTSPFDVTAELIETTSYSMYCVKVRLPNNLTCPSYPPPVPNTAQPMADVILPRHGPQGLSLLVEPMHSKSSTLFPAVTWLYRPKGKEEPCLYEGCQRMPQEGGLYKASLYQYADDYDGVRHGGPQTKRFYIGRSAPVVIDQNGFFVKSTTQGSTPKPMCTTLTDTLNGRWVVQSNTSSNRAWRPWDCTLDTFRGTHPLFSKVPHISLYGDSHGWRFMTCLAAYFDTVCQTKTDAEVAAGTGRVREHKAQCGMKWSETHMDAHAGFNSGAKNLQLHYLYSRYLNETQELDKYVKNDGVFFFNFGAWMAKDDPIVFYNHLDSVLPPLVARRRNPCRPLVWVGLPPYPLDMLHTYITEKFRYNRMRDSTPRKALFNDIEKYLAKKYNIPYVDVFPILLSQKDLRTKDRQHYQPGALKEILDMVFMETQIQMEKIKSNTPPAFCSS